MDTRVTLNMNEIKRLHILKQIVDRRESTLNEAGDFLIPKQEGAFGAEHIQAEIGEILNGTRQGRQSDQEITLFKSLGLAIEDLAAAQHVFDRAQEQGAGVWVEIGGEHFSGVDR